MWSLWTYPFNFVTGYDNTVLVWHLPWRNMMSRFWTYGAVGAPNTQFFISRLSGLCFRSSKACKTWIWSLWTSMFNLVTCCDNPVQVWHILWRNTVSWFWAYGVVWAPNSQFFIPWLPELCFRSSKACKTWLWSLWTYMFDFMNFCDNPVPVWHLL